MLYSSYNSSHFINEYYKKELILEMNIGTPSQKINANINPDSFCFEFKHSKINSTNTYYPYKSKTFQKNKNQNTQSTTSKYISSNDIFNFSSNETYSLSFVLLEKLNINSNTNISLFPVLGFNNPATYFGHNSM